VSSSANICGIIYSHSTNDILAVNIAYLPVTQSSFKEDNFNWRDLHLFYFEEIYSEKRQLCSCKSPGQVQQADTVM